MGSENSGVGYKNTLLYKEVMFFVDSFGDYGIVAALLYKPDGLYGKVKGLIK